MKILYVITALGVGGAEIVTINIANQIVSRDMELLFFI